MEKRETNSDHDMEKRQFANKKNVLRRLIFLEIVSKIDKNYIVVFI